MREIKFKTYVKFLNVFQNVVELYNDGGCMADDYPYALAHDDINLVQFTGLQDKNGVDIYEGDIISITYRGTNGSHKYPPKAVSWDNEKCGFNISKSIECEIIGNIHQNPELITKEE